MLRVKELESKCLVLSPTDIHIITKHLFHVGISDAFDYYQVLRTKQNYTPQDGWTALKKRYLSNNDSSTIEFITITII